MTAVISAHSLQWGAFLAVPRLVVPSHLRHYGWGKPSRALADSCCNTHSGKKSCGSDMAAALAAATYVRGLHIVQKHRLQGALTKHIKIGPRCSFERVKALYTISVAMPATITLGAAVSRGQLLPHHGWRVVEKSFRLSPVNYGKRHAVFDPLSEVCRSVYGESRSQLPPTWSAANPQDSRDSPAGR